MQNITKTPVAKPVKHWDLGVACYCNTTSPSWSIQWEKQRISLTVILNC